MTPATQTDDRTELAQRLKDAHDTAPRYDAWLAVAREVERLMRERQQERAAA